MDTTLGTIYTSLNTIYAVLEELGLCEREELAGHAGELLVRGQAGGGEGLAGSARASVQVSVQVDGIVAATPNAQAVRRCEQEVRVAVAPGEELQKKLQTLT